MRYEPSFVELTDADNYPVLVNVNNVAFVTPAMTVGQNQNGIGVRQLAIGLCAVMMVGQPNPIIVKSSIQELHQLFCGLGSRLGRGE